MKTFFPMPSGALRLLGLVLLGAAATAHAALTITPPKRAQWVRAKPNGREARREKTTRKQRTLLENYSVPPHILGKVNVPDLRGGRIYLVRPLEPALKQQVEQGVRIYTALKGKPLDPTKSVVAPANTAAFQAAVAGLCKKLPPAVVHEIQMSQAGKVKFGPAAPLVDKYKTRFATMDPGAIRHELRDIGDLLRADMSERQAIVGIGYLGQIQEINFFGIVREAATADVQQARRVAQAVMDQAWLSQLVGFLADADTETGRIALKSGPQASPDEQWNAFYLSQFPAVDFEVQIRVLDVTEPNAKGEFDLWGSGDILVAMNTFKERVYFPEGLAGSPVQITRTTNTKSNGPVRVSGFNRVPSTPVR